VAAPPTTLLKREAFKWTDEVEEVFQLLKWALMTAPLLHMPNFDRQFIIDCDALGTRFGAILHQGATPPKATGLRARVDRPC
jgi:hypothetical protein